jgi:predicted RNase H-like nuclease (RuvC/YqgF family)
MRAYGVDYVPDDLVDATMWRNRLILERDGSLEILPPASIALEQGRGLEKRAVDGLRQLDADEKRYKANLVDLERQLETLRSKINELNKALELRRLALDEQDRVERELVNVKGHIAKLPERRSEYAALRHRGRQLLSAFSESER